VGGRDGQLGLRLGREMPAAVAQYRHSRRWERGEEEKVERTARQRLIWVLGEKKGAVCRHSWCAKLGCPMSVRLRVEGCTTATRWSSLAGHWAATAMHPFTAPTRLTHGMRFGGSPVARRIGNSHHAPRPNVRPAIAAFHTSTLSSSAARYREQDRH
jgi:hypothetical protein